MANNALSSFPESLYVLPSLRTLDLSHNRLQRMSPTDLVNVTSLAQLHLARNKLRNIKENSFRDLPNLTILDLESNELEFLSPHAIRSLPRLRAVSLARYFTPHWQTHSCQTLFHRYFFRSYVGETGATSLTFFI